jgi:hypothetical protein
MRKILYIIERKYHKRGRRWEPSWEDGPFNNETIAKIGAAERQEQNPGWAYRAVMYVRGEGL